MIDFDFTAEDGNVHFKIGSVNFVITPEEAISVASDLTEVAEEAYQQQRRKE